VATADVVTLTFEGLGNFEPIAGFYNGELGGFGSGPGSNYGITFGANSLAIISGGAGGTGNFSGTPSGSTIAFFLTGSGNIMDVTGGFTTRFSVFYSAIAYPGSVTIYDGPGATGKVLATLGLPMTPSGGSPECTWGTYCPWVPIGVDFTGTAKSVNFSGTRDQIGFDNITLGSNTPTGVPEPGAVELIAYLTVLSGIALVRRSRRA
jgi:hypothetical protein